MECAAPDGPVAVTVSVYVPAGVPAETASLPPPPPPHAAPPSGEVPPRGVAYRNQAAPEAAGSNFARNASAAPLNGCTLSRQGKSGEFVIPATYTWPGDATESARPLSVIVPPRYVAHANWALLPATFCAITERNAFDELFKSALARRLGWYAAVDQFTGRFGDCVVPTK